MRREHCLLLPVNEGSVTETGATPTLAPKPIDNSTILTSRKEMQMESSGSFVHPSKLSTTNVDVDEDIKTNKDSQSVVPRSATEKPLLADAIDKYSNELGNQVAAKKPSAVKAVNRKRKNLQQQYLLVRHLQKILKKLPRQRQATKLVKITSEWT